MENNSKKEEAFTEQGKTGVVRYGTILQGIHARLVIEGYFLPDGKTWDIYKVGTPFSCEVGWED